MDSNLNRPRVTAAEARALIADAGKKRHKYGAKTVWVDDIRFPSQREANRYCDLKNLRRAGHITDLKLQVPFVFTHNGVLCFTWIADFSYLDKSGARVIEDAKGVLTPVYRLKKTIIQAAYGFKIVEV